jgi:hypothetical protein
MPPEHHASPGSTPRPISGEVGRGAQSARHCITSPQQVHCRVPTHAGATTSRMTTRVASRPPVRITSARWQRAGQLGNHCLRERTCRIDPFVHEHEIGNVPPRPRPAFCRRPRFSLAPTAVARSTAATARQRRTSTVGATVQNAEKSGAIASRIPDSGVMCWHGR